MAKSEKITWKETAALSMRGYRDLHKMSPWLFPSIALHSLMKAVIPYITIYFSAQIINELAGQRRPEQLWRWILATILVEAALSLGKALLARWENVEKTLSEYAKQQIFADKMLSMDFMNMDKQKTHDLFSQIYQNENWNAWGFQIMIENFPDLITGIVGSLGAITLTVSLFTSRIPANAGPLALLDHPAVVAGFALLLILTAVAEPLLSAMADKYWVKSAEMSTLGNRLFGAFGWLSADQSKGMDYRMYNQQDIAQHYLGENSAFGIHSWIAKRARGPMGLLYGLGAGCNVVFTGMVYIFVCLKSWAGAFGVGSVTQYVGAITALSVNISKVLRMLDKLKCNVPFLRTVYELLDMPDEMYQGSLTTEKRSDRQYAVEFRDVSFRYPGNDNWALRHVSMRFKVGSRLAIVGENGSGKTTFIKLLCRMYDPQEGEILLNGIDIRKYNYRDYLGVFSVVFQDFQLLAQPLGANIAGRKDYDRAWAEECLRDAGFGERLASLPEGLDTELCIEKKLDTKGVELSGGEAQKAAIARALYKNAPFIILDEPTAALDPIAEAEIYSKFNEIAGDKTAVYISHRLSSCRFCDEIAVFDHGRIVQQGSHEDLSADTDGKYYALWNAQAQYYTK